MDYLDKYDELLKLITEEVEIDGKKYDLKEDFEKFFIRGNRTAGTRIRKMMQEIKKNRMNFIRFFFYIYIIEKNEIL